METTFLTIEQVLQIHESMIATYGGLAGVRDTAMLHSAVSMPPAMFNEKYLHESIFDMAAAYLYHIVCNHPFNDGNKRTGAATAIIFLHINDVIINADEDGLVDITLQTASGKGNKKAIANFFQKRAM